MATFILLKHDQNEDEDGVITVSTRHHTVEEIAEMLGTDPSAFITVPESHAASVIRPQGRYQEIEEHDTAEDGTNSRAAGIEDEQSTDRLLAGGDAEAGSSEGVVADTGKASDKGGTNRNRGNGKGAGGSRRGKKPAP